jgi:hypothetical protein
MVNNDSRLAKFLDFLLGLIFTPIAWLFDKAMRWLFGPPHDPEG